MTSELITQKRSHEEFFSSSKRQCLEELFHEKNLDISMNELDLQNSIVSDASTSFEDLDSTVMFDSPHTMYSTEDSSAIEMPKLLISEDTSTNVFATCDDSSSNFTSAKDFLNNFFNDYDFEKLEFTDDTIPATEKVLNDEQLQEPRRNTSHPSSKLCNIPPPTINARESPVVIPCRKSEMSSKSTLFEKDLGERIFLTLKFQNKQYNVHIKEFKLNVLGSEEIPTKKGITMDIKSWYEFQYKIFAFNLRYKSSSFVANNTILVLNEHNSIMCIKNLKNYSHIALYDHQLENLKEMAYELNKELIYHMFTKHLPRLIKTNCEFGNVSQENELILMTKFISCIEENMFSILNRIFECFSCIQNQPSVYLHLCSILNNREKFQQLGDMVLMLVDCDFVASSFLNRVDLISEQFLCNINVDIIRNVLFKTLN